MQITDFKKEGHDGRLVITGMIVSSQVLGAVAQKWPADGDGLFDSDYLDRIGGWCVRHYGKFNKAPGKNILSYHRRWAASRSRPTDEDRAVQEFLAGLSDEYLKREAKTVQADYIVQVATDLFTGVAVRRAAEKAKDYAAAGKLDKAVQTLASVGKVDMTDEAMQSVLEEATVVQTSFEESSEPVVVYPGAAGTFFGNRLKRRAFVAFEGPEKRGKSFFLLDVAWRAMQQGRKVAYFELGDMPREDVVMRLASRAANRPVDPADLMPNGVYEYPISMTPTSDGKCDVVLQERKVETKMTWEGAWASFQKTTSKYGTDLFKLSCHPARNISVPGVIQKLERQRDQFSWIPDVCVFDYADLFAPVNGTADTRDQINATWIALRGLAMSWNCLVVTATQANRGSYNTEIIDMEHTADDKRKLGHTTLFVGLNQDDQEKKQGIYRLNKIVSRHGQYGKRDCLYVAGCLAVANPCIRSVFNPGGSFQKGEL